MGLRLLLPPLQVAEHEPAREAKHGGDGHEDAYELQPV